METHDYSVGFRHWYPQKIAAIVGRKNAHGKIEF